MVAKHKAKLVKFRVPNHPGVTRNAKLDAGYLVPMASHLGLPPAAAAAAAVAARTAPAAAGAPAVDAQRKSGPQKQKKKKLNASADADAAGLHDRWIPQEDSDSDKEHPRQVNRSSRRRSRSRGTTPVKGRTGSALVHRPTASRSRSRSASPSPPNEVATGAAAAAAAAAAGTPKHARIPAPAAAAVVSPSGADKPVRAMNWGKLDLSGLRNEERDELRSIVLLNSFAAAVGRSSTGVQLEIACEPRELLDAEVAVEQLHLPANMQPSNCSVPRFIRSYRCGLLVKAKEKDKAWVSTLA